MSFDKQKMSSQNPKNDHSLYHEAKRRASLPQSLQRYTESGSLLLSAPNNIIFELFNTIVKEISSEYLLDFIESSLMEYLEQNWTNKMMQRIFRRFKREQAVDIKAGLKSIPLIKHSTGASTPAKKSSKQQPKGSSEQSPVSSSKSSDSLRSRKSPSLNYETTMQSDRQKAARQIYEHVMWRVRTENVTQVTSLLVKLALDDGYKRGKLKVEVYDDVARNFEEWRSKLLIKLYAFGDAPANDQKLILSSTNQGDLTRWLANYIDGSEKRKNVEMIRTLAGALRDRTKNCIYLTHDLRDAVSSLQTGSIRLALVVDRNKQYEPLNAAIKDSESAAIPLIQSGKLFIMNSLDCVKFAPDPTSESCC